LADVFISYARADETTARRVARGLESAGFDVWWDAEIPAHRAYSEVIERQLDEAKAVVVLWSKTAAESQWVRAEADFGRNAGKLVQAQIDGTMPHMPFNQIQCADLKGWRGSERQPGWAKLKASVDALVSGGEKRAVPPPAARSSRWDSLGRLRLGIAAFLIVLLAAGIWVATRGIPGEAHKPVLAVLPFRSLSAQDQSLVAGMWEDTRTAIGRNPQLIVLGPNTAQQLADKGEGAVRKAADYMLQASVRTAGDRVRVSADLIRTKDGEQVWNQDFDRKIEDVFAVQSEIASEIEGRIRGRLAEKGGTLPQHIATSPDAYALYNDARAKIRSRDLKAYPAARDQLEQVVKIDPNFAPAWATLGEVYAMMSPSQRDWAVGDPSESYARKAIELAPNLASGHAALALSLQLKGPVARSELERAIALDPNDFESLNWLAGILADDGRKKEAIDLLQRAMKIEPLFWPVVQNLYDALHEAGDEQGLRELLEYQTRIGNPFFAQNIEMERAAAQGNLGKAANIGMEVWNSGRPEAQSLIGAGLWELLLQLGFSDEAYKGRLGPAPDFAPFLWRDDLKALDMIDSHHLSPKTFMTVSPLVQNVGRVSLLKGQPGLLADRYSLLNMTPDDYAAQFDDPADFLCVAPLLAISLQRSGRNADAKTLLSVAEQRGQDYATNGKPDGLAYLARVYAVEGRKDQAIAALTGAVSRGWLPPVPMFHSDISTDPAFNLLAGDASFEKLRQQILSKIARERALVNLKLLAQLKTA
jgi:TolB-like protein/Tfp pilus assembly protein PilF